MSYTEGSEEEMGLEPKKVSVEKNTPVGLVSSIPVRSDTWLKRNKTAVIDGKDYTRLSFLK